MTDTKPFTIPPQGFSRAKQILQLLPIGKTKFYKMVKDKEFPQPIRLSPNTVVWKNAEILDWLENLAKQTKA